jgi:hypothetical protein
VDLADFPDGAGGQVQVRVSTRWDDVGLDYPVPRELWMAVRVQAGDLDAAVRSAMGAASALAVIISFCVNAVVEPPVLHVAFNSAVGLSRREFMEAFVPDERGHPRPGRWVEPQDIFAFGQAVLGSAEVPRLARALAQYQTALRYWNSGSRVLVLAHLYIASEALTKAVLRVHQTRLGITEREHARLLGVDVTQNNWKMIAGAFARREYIFEGDKAIYDAARKASDDFEHGLADLGVVRQAADNVARDLFDLIRSAILSILPTLDPSARDAIMSRGPVDVSPFYKQVTGYIVSDEPSDPLNLGMPGELFPALRWQSQIRACRLEDDQVVFEPLETFTVQFAPGLRFEVRDLAIYGGLNPSPKEDTGSRPVGWSQGASELTQLPDSRQAMVSAKRDLLASVMPLVDAAAATGSESSQPLTHVVAFNLFGLGVSYFQSAQTLIASRQPVEALLSLRGLVTIAARFEQMTEDHGDGLGLAVRLVLDSLKEQAGQPGDKSDPLRVALIQAAADAGLIIPDRPRSATTSSIWRRLSAEMEIARYCVDVSYAITGPHMKLTDAGGVGFDTHVSPGPLTDLIASACVIAQLELLQRAAQIFGWTTDSSAINELLVEARKVNEESAQVGLEHTGDAAEAEGSAD